MEENMNPEYTATALAHPNIAFIKYWGNRNDALRLALNDSLSMNLAALHTRTTVRFLLDGSQASDTLVLNGRAIQGDALVRVSGFLNLVRQRAGVDWPAHIISDNNFPTGAGIASSAAAFAALALAASAALGLHLTEKELSILARRGSGSACRSIPAGFVAWHAGVEDGDSYAETIAPPSHWNLVDCVAVIQSAHKPVGSTAGHTLAGTSLLQAARVADAPRRAALCRQAILDRDFEALAVVTELDSNLMHAVMQTSTPPLLYWEPQSVEIMKSVMRWRQEGLPVCYTLDAGPNVHVLTLSDSVDEVEQRLRAVDGVAEVLVSAPGGAARLEPSPKDLEMKGFNQ
ncbi:MAG: diphosphomevalonate decarboxylase [Anaerolineae bacterium]|nr:diphosphomevalonate decarboxylase [Anaerolineae bacterium]